MGWQDAPEVGASPKQPAWMSAPEVDAKPAKMGIRGEGFDQAMNYSGANAVGGAVRGAGSIGATGMRVLPNALGGDTAQENAQRRTDMDSALKSLGADPESLPYKTLKLGTELAGTSAVGGVAGNAIARLAGLVGMGAKAVPLVNALQSSGMTTGGGMSALKDIAVRTGAGATVGGVSAGMVDPNDAGTGALIGGALPGGLKLAGAAGAKLGQVLSGTQATPEAMNAIQTARGAGYVIPPTQAKPSLGNKLLEGYAGKLTTAQNASAKNAAVTNKLAATAIGLPQDTQITQEILTDIRKTAGQAYEAMGGTGTVNPGKPYFDALDKLAAQHKVAAQGFPDAKPSPVIDMIETLKSPSFDASAAVAKIKELRAAADDAFRTGNTDIARASKGAAKALEDAMDQHLQQSGSPDVLNSFRDARTLIAKTYSVEKALNPTTGTIDARKLGQLINRGKPLTGDLRKAGEFANRFPTAAKTPESMGSLPQNSPLDWAAGAAASAAHGNLLPLAGAIAGRPLARSAALSSFIQNRLGSNPKPNAIAELLKTPEARQMLYRAAPVTYAQ